MLHGLALHYAGPQHIISRRQTFEIGVGFKRILNKKRTESGDIRKEKWWCGSVGWIFLFSGCIMWCQSLVV